MSELTNLLNEDDEEVITNTGEQPPVLDDDDNSVELSQLEVAGVVRDKYGNTWQVPADNVEDFDDLYAPDAYAKLPDAITKDFHVQGVPMKRVQEYMSKGFIPLRLEEVGIPAEARRMTGQPLDGYHVVGDMVLMKIPHKLAQRIQLAVVKETKRRLASIEPTADMVRKSAASGVATKVERTQNYTPASMMPGKQLKADDQGNVE